MFRSLHLLLITALMVVGFASCSSLQQSTKLVEGRVVLDIAPVQVDVLVDTTQSLQGISKTTVILGLIRIGDNKFADYPGMPFGPGAATREKRAAIYKALDGTDFDVLVNPKYIVKVNRALFFRRTTCAVAGYGGKFEFQ